MAKRRATSDQSPKQAILICLGICIPLIIGLGVATYFGFAGQKERDDRATKAEQDKSKFQKELKTSDDKVALLSAYVGLPPDKNGDFATLHDQGLTGGDQQTANMIKELDKDPGWDPVKRAPKDTLKNRIAKLTTDVEEATKKQAKLNTDHAKDMADLRTANATNKTEEENLRKKLEEIEKKKEDDQEKLLANLTKAQQEINRLRDEIDDKGKKAVLE
ncbi:MAG TPA: hypothetical protein VGX70_01300, partial [Gemmataceae bacterium]|nr:hypothetical protein [Gemmataceae bacterium]